MLVVCGEGSGRTSRGLTSNVIQEMGSSCGISVRLTSSSVSFSSSKANVKMAPGGVQVPTMRWWMGILLLAVRGSRVCLAARYY